MFHKVGEHIWRDFRPFLHAKPFKIRHILRFALYISDHVFSIGFKSRDWNGHRKTFILFSLNHFCVDFEVCLGSSSSWKVHLPPSLSFLAEATRFLAKMPWYSVEFIMPLILTRAPGPLAVKQPQSINDPPPDLTVGMRTSSFFHMLEQKIELIICVYLIQPFLLIFIKGTNNSKPDCTYVLKQLVAGHFEQIVTGLYTRETYDEDVK